MIDENTVEHKDLVSPILEVLKNDDDARVYLEHRWVGSSQLSLRQAFRASGLAIEQVAEHMGVSVRTASRCLHDVNGNITIARYAAFMSACGVSLFDIEHAPTSAVQQQALLGLDATVTIKR